MNLIPRRLRAAARSWLTPRDAAVSPQLDRPPVESLETRRLLAADAPVEPAPPPEPAQPAEAVETVDAGEGFGLASLAGGLTGPISLDGFRLEGDDWFVDGNVHLPGDHDIPFAAPAEISVEQDDGSVTILDVRLGRVDLDLLGLHVDLAPVALEVVATPGEGQVLGNVLTELLTTDPDAALDALAGPLNEAFATAVGGGDRLMASLPVDSTLDDLDDDLDYAALVGDVSLLDFAAGASPFATTPIGEGSSTAAAAPVDVMLPDEVRVLSLEIEELNLNVLGLRVRTLEPVDLSVRAEAGPGRLLGNLFVGLSSLLDPLLPTGPLDDGGGEEPPTPDRPSSFDLLADDEIPVIGLELRDVDLYLLGLEASLNVDLLVGLTTGRGDLLGSLLLEELKQIEEEVLAADFDPLQRLFGFLFDGPPGMGGGGGTVTEALGDAAPAAIFSDDAVSELSPPGRNGPIDPDPVSLLDLSIDELDLDLLGVLIRSEGISLELRADPGPGALLGNLLGRLLGAFEGDVPPVAGVPSPTPAAAPPAEPSPATPTTTPATFEVREATRPTPAAPTADRPTDAPRLRGGGSPVAPPSIFADDDDRRPAALVI